jgi:hypothetical protein
MRADINVSTMAKLIAIDVFLCNSAAPFVFYSYFLFFDKNYAKAKPWHASPFFCERSSDIV